MTAAGLLIQTKGHAGRKPAFARVMHQTTIEHGSVMAQLIQECGLTMQDIWTNYAGQESVILKGEDTGEDGADGRIDYEDTPITSTYRAEIQLINTFLAESDIRLFGYAGIPLEVVSTLDHRERTLAAVFYPWEF
jgi:hypothetical protein